MRTAARVSCLSIRSDMETYPLVYFFLCLKQFNFSLTCVSVFTILGSILSLWNFLLLAVAVTFISRSHSIYCFP